MKNLAIKTIKATVALMNEEELMGKEIAYISYNKFTLRNIPTEKLEKYPNLLNHLHLQNEVDEILTTNPPIKGVDAVMHNHCLELKGSYTFEQMIKSMLFKVWQLEVTGEKGVTSHPYYSAHRNPARFTTEGLSGLVASDELHDINPPERISYEYDYFQSSWEEIIEAVNNVLLVNSTNPKQD